MSLFDPERRASDRERGADVERRGFDAERPGFDAEPRDSDSQRRASDSERGSGPERPGFDAEPRGFDLERGGSDPERRELHRERRGRDDRRWPERDGYATDRGPELPIRAGDDSWPAPPDPYASTRPISQDPFMPPRGLSAREAQGRAGGPRDSYLSEGPPPVPQRYVAPNVPTQQLFEPAGRREPAPRPAQPPAVRAPEPAESRRTRESTTRIALIYPELLGTYGDGGNAIVLSQRLRWRGLSAEIVSVPAGEPVPAGCDIYLLGGGEDEPQTLAAEGLQRGGAIARAVSGGAAVLAVCAGYQVIGASFPAGGKIYDGLGLLGVETRRSFDPPDAPLPPRVVGDIVLDPDPSLRLPTVLGYENHGGRTRPLPGARGVPFGRVRLGLGNGIADGTDGLVDGTVLGTYLHGPLLAQNPAVADLLLSWVHGSLAPLPGPPEVDALRAARLRALQVA
jgi:CobQ-like glutamine amidotransferase family enzyme